MPPPNFTSAPLSKAGQTASIGLGSVGIGYSSLLISIFNATPAVPITGLTVAFDGDEGNQTWQIPLGGIRTDTGASETGSSSPIIVSVMPSAWRCEVDNILAARFRIVAITGGAVTVTLRAGSFFASQPINQVIALLAGGSTETPNLVTWELDEIRRVLCDISNGARSDYRTPPTPTPLPAVYEAGTNS